jgi:hypothetical protein
MSGNKLAVHKKQEVKARSESKKHQNPTLNVPSKHTTPTPTPTVTVMDDDSRNNDNGGLRCSCLEL